jgi:hypothetical protein
MTYRLFDVIEFHYTTSAVRNTSLTSSTGLKPIGERRQLTKKATIPGGTMKWTQSFVATATGDQWIEETITSPGSTQKNNKQTPYVIDPAAIAYVASGYLSGTVHDVVIYFSGTTSAYVDRMDSREMCRILTKYQTLAIGSALKNTHVFYKRENIPRKQGCDVGHAEFSLNDKTVFLPKDAPLLVAVFLDIDPKLAQHPGGLVNE